MGYNPYKRIRHATDYYSSREEFRYFESRGHLTNPLEGSTILGAVPATEAPEADEDPYAGKIFCDRCWCEIDTPMPKGVCENCFSILYEFTR